MCWVQPECNSLFLHMTFPRQMNIRCLRSTSIGRRSTYPQASDGSIVLDLVLHWHSCVSGIVWRRRPDWLTGVAAIISMSHLHKDVAGARLKKMHRMGIRLIVAVVLVCLPLAKSLNSLQLIGTVTGLVVFVLIVDIYGHTNVETAFFGGRRHCAYTADCPMKKKDLEHAVKSGETVTIQALAEKESGEKALFESS